MARVHVSDGGMDLASLCGYPAGDVVTSSVDATCMVCLSALTYCGASTEHLAPVGVGGRR